MRINGPNTQFGIQTGKVKRAGDADGNFELPEEASGADGKPAAKTSGAPPMSALIAAQLHGVDEREQEERRRKRQKGVARGNTILTALDEIKIEMLAGRLSPAQVLKLIGTIEGREGDSDDPRLEALLDEIELRARVELAKLQRKNVMQA